MLKYLSILAAAVAAFAISGCASPWTAGVASHGAKAPDRRHEPRAVSPAEQRQMEDTLAELRQSGVIDPAAEERLVADLRQSDPSLWPLVIQQCRATQAYRREATRRSGSGEFARGSKGDSSIFAETQTETVPARTGTVPAELGAVVRRLPPAEGTGMAATEFCADAYPSTSLPLADYQVTQASYAAPSLGQWRQRLGGAIEALENETPPSATTPGDLGRQARLRLLYAAAGRREEAARPIPDVGPATQEFVSKEMQGLGLWLDAAETADPVCRTIEVKAALSEALTKLGEAAPLLVRNAAFCSEVLSFGCLKRCDKSEFFQDQHVLLYAELENFTSEPTEKGFRTSLRSGYQIVDRFGQPVVWHEFAPTQDHCKNVRRDFFIAYHVRLPKLMTPGKYTLRLLIQDTARQKTGQASIEFTVKEGKAEPEKKTEGGKEKEKKEH
jgi:hypothetical protein